MYLCYIHPNKRSQATDRAYTEITMNLILKISFNAALLIFRSLSNQNLVIFIPIGEGFLMHMLVVNSAGGLTKPINLTYKILHRQIFN